MANDEETRILYLTIHRRWFDDIVSGEKCEEFRDVKPYWTKRIEGREYNEIHFRNGYGKDAPFMRVEYKGGDSAPWLEKGYTLCSWDQF